MLTPNLSMYYETVKASHIVQVSIPVYIRNGKKWQKTYGITV